MACRTCDGSPATATRARSSRITRTPIDKRDISRTYPRTLLSDQVRRSALAKTVSATSGRPSHGNWMVKSPVPPYRARTPTTSRVCDVSHDACACWLPTDPSVHQALNHDGRELIGLGVLVEQERNDVEPTRELVAIAVVPCRPASSPSSISSTRSKWAVSRSACVARARAHERHDSGIPSLMDGERVKEPFDDDHRAGAGVHHPVEVEEHERLAEAGRKAILRFLTIEGASGVGDELTALIVDGNHDTTAQKAAATIEAHAKRADRLRARPRPAR